MFIDWPFVICFMPMVWFFIYQISHNSFSNRVSDYCSTAFVISTVVFIIAIIAESAQWQPFVS